MKRVLVFAVMASFGLGGCALVRPGAGSEAQTCMQEVRKNPQVVAIEKKIFTVDVDRTNFSRLGDQSVMDEEGKKQFDVFLSGRNACFDNYFKRLNAIGEYQTLALVQGIYTKAMDAALKLRSGSISYGEYNKGVIDRADALSYGLGEIQKSRPVVVQSESNTAQQGWGYPGSYGMGVNCTSYQNGAFTNTTCR